MFFKITHDFHMSLSVDRPPPGEGEVAKLTSEEREKYRQFCRKFKWLAGIQWIALLFLLAICWARPSSHGGIVDRLLMIPVVLFIIARIWIYNLDCPRCGARFSGGPIRALSNIYPSNCYGCYLRRDEIKQRLAGRV